MRGRRKFSVKHLYKVWVKELTSDSISGVGHLIAAEADMPPSRPIKNVNNLTLTVVPDYS